MWRALRRVVTCWLRPWVQPARNLNDVLVPYRLFLAQTSRNIDNNSVLASERTIQCVPGQRRIPDVVLQTDWLAFAHAPRDRHDRRHTGARGTDHQPDFR